MFGRKIFSLGGGRHDGRRSIKHDVLGVDSRAGGHAGFAFWPDAEHRSVRPQRARLPLSADRHMTGGGWPGLLAAAAATPDAGLVFRSVVDEPPPRAPWPTDVYGKRRRRPHRRPTVYRDGTRDRRWAAERRLARRAHNACFRCVRTSRRPATRTRLRQLLCFVLDVKPDGRARFAAADAFT